MTFSLNDTAETRFWAKVDKSGECWMWTARVDKNGYGRFRPDGANHSEVPAHRVAVMLDGREVPDGMVAMHSCDTPGCVRPSHLQIGTHAENIADRDRKGRFLQPGIPEGRGRGKRSARHTHPETTARGEGHGNARWTVEQIREMRAAYAGGESQGSIGRRYGTSQGNVSNIVRRTAWAHVA